MFERFTDRARKVMQLANQQAQGFNHEYVGTEHILLGLIKEGNGVAAHVLKNLGVDLKTAREEVEKLVECGPEKEPTGKLPQTPRAKKAIEFAIEEARALNHNYVGTEHILLGLLRETEGLATIALINMNVKLEAIRKEVLGLLNAGKIANDQAGKVVDINILFETVMGLIGGTYKDNLSLNNKFHDKPEECQAGLIILIEAFSELSKGQKDIFKEALLECNDNADGNVDDDTFTLIKYACEKFHIPIPEEIEEF